MKLDNNNYKEETISKYIISSKVFFDNIKSYIFKKINNKRIKHINISIKNERLYKIFTFYIFINLFFGIIPKKKANNLIYSQNSIITLKINSPGNVYIYHDDFIFSCYPNSPPLPDEIYINDIKQNNIKTNYDFEEGEHNIKLIWENYITSTRCMFTECSKIIEINLSQFDTSELINMQGMFRGCSSLTSIDLSNFNTQKVTNMGAIFCECSSLLSLDLSKFDTSQVTYLNSMFYGCSSLTTLDLSNFNTKQVSSFEQMFYNCASLISLDISNFDTSQLTSIRIMFSGCSSLKSLNLGKFDTSKITNIGYLFLVVLL